MTNSAQAKTYSRKKLRKLLKLGEKDKLPRLSVLAHVIDNASGKGFLEVVFKTEAGPYRSITISKDLVYHPAQVRDLLTKADALLSRDPSDANAKVAEALKSDAPLWWASAPALGWRPGAKSFVLHDRVLGENQSGRNKAKRRIKPPQASDGSPLASLDRVGDLEEWKKTVASRARYSSGITLGLAIAFAAPLMTIIDWPTFLVVIYSSSKVGKSVVALAAASVIGIGSEQKLQNWNLTDASIEEVAQCYNDLPLVMNGLESSKLKDKELRDLIRNVTYILNDGQGKRRHSSWKGNGQAGRGWRTIVLVTSEHSFDEIAAKAGETRMGGEQARAFDVPAIFNGDESIIDFFPKEAPNSAAERQHWARKVVEELRPACAQHHGVALKPYIQHLINLEPETLKADIAASREEFMNAVEAKLSSEPLRHAAKNFSVIYAGGVQAIGAKLLPITKERLLRRIVKCFVAELDDQKARPDPPKRGLKMLLDGLEQAEAERETLKGKFERSRAPWPGLAEPTVVFQVHASEVFRRWFLGDDVAMRAALRWLCEQGLLDVKNKAEAVSRNFTIDSVRRVRRLAADNVGCIVFRDPRPALKTETEEAKRVKSGDCPGASLAHT